MNVLQQSNASNALEKIQNVDRKVRKYLMMLDELQDEIDFVTAKLRYAYVTKCELMKKLNNIGNQSDDGGY